jgi:membrane protein YqaA with SNARE-associated domain
MNEIAAFLGLAASAFLSATLLPGTSEVALLGLVNTWPELVFALFLVATIANTAGSVLNWWLGRHALRYADHKLFPVSREKIDKAQSRFQKHGVWALLLSWVPFFGDALTVVAGILRVPLASFIALVALAKGARYAAFLGGFLAVS